MQVGNNPIKNDMPQNKEEEKEREISISYTMDDIDPFKAVAEELRLLRVLQTNMDKVIVIWIVN